MEDFGFLSIMNKETFLKIYDHDDNGIDRYEFNYIALKKVCKNAYSPNSSLIAFAKTLEEVKVLFTYFDCDHS